MTDIISRAGVRVPGWAITACIITGSVFLAGVSVGRKIDRLEVAVENLQLQVCAMQASGHQPVWPTCRRLEEPSTVAASVLP